MTLRRFQYPSTAGRACVVAALACVVWVALPAELLAAEEEHGSGLLQIVARLFNFAILAGVLVYFLRSPVAEYLRTRSDQIRQDLVTAAETRRAATTQLEQIGQQLASLPAELDLLKKRGAEDTAAEEVRIAEAAKVEKQRLLEQARREIEMRLRIARRELTEFAAALAVQVAEARIARAITPDDQMRLLDRYAAQLAQRPPAGGGEAR